MSCLILAQQILVLESIQTVHSFRLGLEITLVLFCSFLVVLGLFSKSRNRTAVYSWQMSTYWFVLEGPICSAPVKDVGLETGKGHVKTLCSNIFDAAVLAVALALVTDLLSLITDRQPSSKKGGFSKC